jgi:hypothetical protein
MAVISSDNAYKFRRKNESNGLSSVSPGGAYNPATLSVKIDKQNPLPWPRKENAKIEGLDRKGRHLVVLFSDAKRIQSFWFRFGDFETTKLCMSFDGYQGAQLHEDRESQVDRQLASTCSVSLWRIFSFSVLYHCGSLRSLGTHDANASMAMGLMLASRKVSLTNRWRSFSLLSATSVTAANSEAKRAFSWMRFTV